VVQVYNTGKYPMEVEKTKYTEYSSVIINCSYVNLIRCPLIETKMLPFHNIWMWHILPNNSIINNAVDKPE
jgi:hypothetical protein